MGHLAFWVVCGRDEHGGCRHVRCNELELRRIRRLESILDHLAHLVAGRRRGRSGHYATAAFVDSRSAAEMDRAAVARGGDTAWVSHDDGRNRLWADFSRTDEKRSLDVFVHTVSHLG